MMLKISDALYYVKHKKVRLSYLSSEMGYTPTHISRVLHQRCGTSPQFKKLLTMALIKKFPQDKDTISQLGESL